MKPTPSLRRPKPRSFLRSVATVATVTLVISLGVFAVAMYAVEPPVIRNGTCGAGSVTVKDGTAFLLLDGDGAACGTQAGTLLKERTLSILRRIRLQRSYHLSETTRTALSAGLSADHRAELDALATASSIERDALYDANLALDTQCTVLITGADGKGPVRFARNMDFFPAQMLGPSTVVTVWRVPGKRSFAGIGWPGYAGVISGMNDAGVVATVLKNSRWSQEGGTPLPYRVREVLETARNLDEAVAAFQRTPTSSDHFVVLADATRAAVVWYDGSFHRRDPVNGVLTCSNGEPDRSGDQHDDRTQAMRALVADGKVTDDTQLKQALTRVYLSDINAQAMLFRPELREVDLALASMLTPACKRDYQRIGLGACLDGKGLESITTAPAGTVKALPHY